MKLKQKITEIYTNSRKTYGSPRIYQKLLREGYAMGKKRVASALLNHICFLLQYFQ